ncbi:hypothetical protein QOZ80_6BG0473380 [Eleusine coracana subsp. coracana]|nr:hypothetical protein QOZ80_6BG0473380 [Eleusine coracana subsp. coracana]
MDESGGSMEEVANIQRVSIDEANSNSSIIEDDSESKFRINLKILRYTSLLDDDSSKEFRATNHVVGLSTEAYLMKNLLSDVAAITKWGSCQEPVFWYWNKETKGLKCVVMDDDLKSVFQQFGSTKTVPFVVEFALKPLYKCNIMLDHKLEKLPEEDNVDPALKDDEDVFMEDNDVFLSFGLRAEDVTARMNMDKEPLGLNVDAQILVDDYATDEPRFAIDKEHPKLKKGETFPTMADFRMALR